jgi:hypothetical protein
MTLPPSLTVDPSGYDCFVRDELENEDECATNHQAGIKKTFDWFVPTESGLIRPCGH